MIRPMDLAQFCLDVDWHHPFINSSSRFNTQDTFPGRINGKGGRWTDRLPLVEGHFTPDGAGVVVADAAGQVRLRRPALRLGRVIGW